MRLQQQLIVFIFFMLIGFQVLYYPLLHSGTHITGNTSTDYHLFYWAFWWGEKALTTPELNVYESDYVMYPFEHNLAYHTLALGWLPVWVPAKALLGQFHAMNLIFMLALSLTGFFTFLALRQEGIALGLALLGGVALEVSLPMLRAIWWSQANLVALFCFPLHIWLWGRVRRHVSKPALLLFWASLQGVGLWWMLLLDNQYVLLTAPLLIPYGLLGLWEAGKFRWRLLLAGGLMLSVAICLLWFAGPLPQVMKGLGGEFVRASLADAEGITRWDAFLWNHDDYYTIARVGAVIPAAIFLGLLGSNRVKGRWFWFALIPLPLLLSLGPQTPVYPVLHDLLGGVFRYPDRFIIPFSLPALLFAGISLSPAYQRLKPSLRPLLTGLLLLLIFLNLRSLAPMPIQAVPTQYEFYQQMGAEPYDYVVIEVPNAAGTGVHWVGDIDSIALEYYGTIHGKKMVNALLSRTPTAYWWYLRTDDPLLSWLGQRRYLEADLVEAQLQRIIYDYPVGYIVIHPELIQGLPSTTEEILGYFNSLPQFFCPPVVEKGAIAFRTRWHPDGCQSTRQLPPSGLLDIGAAGDEIYLGPGWHYREQVFDVNLRWIGKNLYLNTDLYLDLPPASYTISIQAQSFWDEQELYIHLNDQALNSEAIRLGTELQTFQLKIPAERIGAGQNLKLSFVYDHVYRVKEIMPESGDQRELAIAVDWIRFEAID